MCKKMIVSVLVLALARSASAGVPPPCPWVWNDRTKIHELPGGGIEIRYCSVVANARVDLNNPGWLIIRSGAEVFFNDTFQFPDEDEGGPGPTIHIESGGYLQSADTESIGERLYDGGLFLDVGAIFKTGNIGEGDRHDPRSGEWRIYPWGAADGYEITIDGDWAIVHGTPEPATVALLGLGAAMVRRVRNRA